MKAWIASEGIEAVFRNAAWEYGTVRGERLTIAGEQVVGGRSAAIASPTGGSTVDVECRAALTSLLGAMRAHGLIAS